MASVRDGQPPATIAGYTHQRRCFPMNVPVNKDGWVENGLFGSIPKRFGFKSKAGMLLR